MPRTRSSSVPLVLLFVASVVFSASADAQQNPDGRLPIGDTDDPLVWLIRDPYVLDRIEATDEQRRAFRELADRIDSSIWPARNRPAADAQRAWREATELAQREIESRLKPEQRHEFYGILYRVLGPRGLERPDLADRLELTAEQRQQVAELLASGRRELASLQQRREQGEAIETLQREATESTERVRKELLEQLTVAQRTDWSKLLGESIDFAQLGAIDFAAPPLPADPNDWIGRPPQGYGESPVTVIHFFAHGCINCRRNYERYREWDAAYRDRGVRVVGIHTPETEEERDRSLLERRIAEAKFEFPVLVDGRSEQWNRWGNSMWPTVYLVDRQGRVRGWWIGELQWQGQTGDQAIARRIETLLAEDAAKPGGTSPPSGRRP
ncbi:MAG TPA: hypothetical protein DCQ98_07965 [Planctomycetaceae bacterium]|nr:hypothetical protein [Planctomycetaceae bacterium]HRF02430.1 redoxin domain-containing protein [Pirellulaceae bacterium]